MSAGINHYSNSSIGRMFARQNVPSVYGKQKPPDAPEEQEKAGLVDQVSLSPNAPRPLTADFLKDALDTGAALAGVDGGGGAGGGAAPLSEQNAARLREDRIFAAVSALALMGHNGEGPVEWPGGIPAPTRAELETARRRLAQRPQNMERTENPADVQTRRAELLEKITRRDFGQVTLPPVRMRYDGGRPTRR